MLMDGNDQDGVKVQTTRAGTGRGDAAWTLDEPTAMLVRFPLALVRLARPAGHPATGRAHPAAGPGDGG